MSKLKTAVLRTAILAASLALGANANPALAQDPAASAAPGVVCNIKVFSDKVPDVSSLEAWKKSTFKDTMSDQEKALAIWKSVVAHVYDTSPPQDIACRVYAHRAKIIYRLNRYPRQSRRLIGIGALHMAAHRPRRLRIARLSLNWRARQYRGDQEA